MAQVAADYLKGFSTLIFPAMHAIAVGKRLVWWMYTLLTWEESTIASIVGRSIIFDQKREVMIRLLQDTVHGVRRSVPPLCTSASTVSL